MTNAPRRCWLSLATGQHTALGRIDLLPPSVLGNRPGRADSAENGVVRLRQDGGESWPIDFMFGTSSSR